MPGFYGYRTVIADLRKHMLGTGKVVGGTLKYRTAGSGDTLTSLTWTNLYVWPQTEVTGFEGKGYADTDGQITAWRTGEAQAPRVDDQWLIAGRTYLIKHVTPRLNADEALNFAVYDCAVTS